MNKNENELIEHINSLKTFISLVALKVELIELKMKKENLILPDSIKNGNSKYIQGMEGTISGLDTLLNMLSLIKDPKMTKIGEQNMISFVNRQLEQSLPSFDMLKVAVGEILQMPL